MTHSSPVTAAIHQMAMLAELRDWFAPPPWAQGNIGLGDAGFISSIIGESGARSIAEVGVASGVSSALILWLLHRHQKGHLSSVDISHTCYFDAARRCGDAVLPMLGDVALLQRWSIHLGRGASFLGGGIERFDLAFIDGSHLHPATTLDVIALLPAMVPGAWIIMHDIRLMQMYPHCTNLPDYGPQILFDAWPLDKLDPGPSYNIGAIRLGMDHQKNLAILQAVAALPLPLTL